MFAFGLVVSVVMVLRSQNSEDQFYLLLRGWLLVDQGWLVPFGNPMSGGGFEPGPLTSLLVGLPLLIWEDFRAINGSILLTHVVAYLLLDRTLRGVLDSRGRLLLCLLYWFNPWRMYYSAYLWNPNWLFLLAVIHLWTAARSRERARWWLSLLHVVCVGCAFQLHGSFLILAIASLLLYLRGYLRIHWPGAVAGALIIAGSLLPWVLAVLDHPQLLPVREGFLGRGFVYVYPVFKGVLYWMRYPVLHLWSQMTDLDFVPLLGGGANAVLRPVLTVLTRVAGPLSVVFSVLANLWLWRRPRTALRRCPAGGAGRTWVKGYLRWTFLAAVVSFGLSPTEVMSWQGLIVMHAAIIVMTLWADLLWRTRLAGRVAWAVRIQAVALAVVIVAIALAAPPYRREGETRPFIAVPEPVAMLDRLGVTEHCKVVIAPSARGSRLLRGRERWAEGLQPGEEM